MFNFFAYLSERKNRNIRNREMKSFVPQEDSAIHVKNINFSYGSNKVVDDFSFDFKKNVIYTILGPSASGKSTIISHFNGLLKSPTANIYL